MWSRLRSWARALKRDVVALWVAARDRQTPPLAKIVAAFVAAYALSPIDLIPDFVPILGYVDDLLLVPLGVWCAIQLIPPVLMAECRLEATDIYLRPASRLGLAGVVVIWIGMAGCSCGGCGQATPNSWLPEGTLRCDPPVERYQAMVPRIG